LQSSLDTSSLRKDREEEGLHDIKLGGCIYDDDDDEVKLGDINTPTQERKFIYRFYRQHTRSTLNKYIYSFPCTAPMIQLLGQSEKEKISQIIRLLQK
jgi:hypothetical protein